MVTQPSLLAYLELKHNLALRQDLVLGAIMRLYGGTDSEIMRHLGYSDPNRVRPRRRELVKMGLVRSNGLIQCSVTGKMVNEWVVT